MRTDTHARRARRAASIVSTLTLVVAAAALGLRARAGTATTAPAAASEASDRSDEWPITECGTVTGTGCAPTKTRVDLVRPQFSHPTRITNPLFPVSSLRSVVQTGIVERKPFRSETTTLPETDVVDWYGRKVRVVLSQYTAWLDGRIEEIALDRYAQADDGSVWYFGEDVTDYEHGTAKFTEGTWLAGRDGPPAMVMPAHPKVGDVFRVENVIGIVFEELTVKRVNQTVRGPNGRVHGAIVVDELGVTGGHSEKTLAPRYGEFLTQGNGEIEAMAIATPTNALPGGVPLEIRKILTAAGGTLEYVRAEDWDTARASTERISMMFDRLRTSRQPPRVTASLATALRGLEAAIHAKQVARAERRAVDVAESALDLEARYLRPEVIEVERFHLHAQRLRVFAAARDAGGVEGEVASMEWVRDRIASRLGGDHSRSLDQRLRDLRDAADAGNLASAADHAIRAANYLRRVLTGSGGA